MLTDGEVFASRLTTPMHTDRRELAVNAKVICGG